MDTECRLTEAQAVQQLFGIALSKHPVLRHSVSTLVTALTKDKVLHLQKVKEFHTTGSRSRKTLPASDLTTLSNAIILQGIFGEPKIVRSLFTDPATRSGHADRARSLLLERQSVASVGLINQELLRLLSMLDSPDDLRQKRLPNPFDNNVFPQMGLSDYGGNLLRALACQTASLSLGDSMMAYYLKGELEQAYLAASELQTENVILLQYQRVILRDYREAQAFDELLDAWR
ncbi:hypothetical protein [Pokkaliibacter plantistimulans]|uniref:hypothetical protein n=1 Tax=Pokkaliibacter plantistimulans TaxID=1635171 RepID=UPI000D750B93|nr:hypothetical protein [Pokkaliibacter plantistimulans]